MERSIELIPGEAEAAREDAPPERARAAKFDGAAALVLSLLLLFGLGLRLHGVSEIGFAEDEINKLEAVRAYARGDITQNAEHPMLMKTLIFVSMRAASFLNDWRGGAAGGGGRAGDAEKLISDEAALRFPNVLFGALTVLPLFLLTHALFGRREGLLAAAFWACGVNAVTYNRVGKEDTLLVFFMLTAFYLYARAKQTSGFEPGRKRRFYLASAASFGLMFASKYFPHYFGLNMLYHHFARLRERAPGEPPGRTPPVFYLVVVLAFLVANPAVLLPATWHYVGTYSSEQLLTHHGYLFGDTLYPNQISSTPFGTPAYFYLLFLAIKVPPPVTAAMLVGLFACARRRREPGPMFLLLMFALWIVPYSLAGAKWLRYTLSLMPFVYMLAAVGAVAVWRSGLSLLRRKNLAVSPGFVASAVALGFLVLPALAALLSGPHYALYTNALAAGRAGHFFPHDEFYDDGLREALKFVAATAPRGATVAHETPGVARYYLTEFGREDLDSRVLSDPQFRPEDAPRPSYFILQRGRTYFENRDEMEAVRAALPRVHLVSVEGVSAVEVYAKQ